MRHSTLWIPWALLLALSPACSGDAAAPPAADGDVAPAAHDALGDSVDDAGPADDAYDDVADLGPTCPPGHLPGAGDACAPTGIPGCAALFLDEHGICDPSLAACPAGTIPRLEEGCFPVGIDGCPAELLGEDALCHPWSARCPAGTIPDVDLGCVPVGIQGCAAQFIGDDGLCRPTAGSCPPGAIPDLDVGCAPVGVPSCAAAFVSADGLCRPTMEACAAGTFAVPSAGCAPIGGPAGCVDVVVEPGAAAAWVDPGYGGADADGTAARPWTSLTAAVIASPPGGHVVLAAGTYDEPLVPFADLVVEGRCPQEVTLTGVTSATSDGAAAIVYASGPLRLTLRGVRLSGPGHGVLAEGGATVSLERSWVQGAALYGVRAGGAGTAVAVTDTLIDSTVAETSPSKGGQGATVRDGATLTLERSTLYQNSGSSLDVRDGAAATLVDCAVLDTQPQADGKFGRGVQVTSGASLSVHGSVVRSSHEIGVAVSGQGTEVVLEDSVVDDTRPRQTDQRLGIGVTSEQGPAVVIERSAVVASRKTGVRAMSASLELRASLVARTLPDASDGTEGQAALVALGGALTIEGSTLYDNHYAGIAVFGAGTQLTLSDSVVQQNTPQPADGALGVGVVITDGASATLTGNAIRAVRFFGVSADGGATLTASHNLVEGVTPDDFGQYTGAVDVDHAASAALQGNAMLDNVWAGITVSGAGTVVHSTRDLVGGSAPTPSTGGGGFGLRADEGAEATVTGGAYVGNHRTGLVCSAATVSADGLIIESTLGETGLEPSGSGVGIGQAGHVELRRCAVLGNRNIGVSVYGPGASVHLERSLVEGTLPHPADERFGRGVQVDAGATAKILSSALLDNRSAGVAVDEPGSHLLLDRSLIAGTLPRASDQLGGSGVVVTAGSTLESHDNTVTGSAATNLFVHASEATSTGDVLEGALGIDADAVAFGVVTTGGGSLTLTGSALVGNRFAGALCSDPGAHLEIVDCLIAHTLPSSANGQYGVGALIQAEATAALSGTLIADNHAVGVLTSFGAHTSIDGCAVEGTRAGSFFSQGAGLLHEGVGDGLAATSATLDVWASSLRGHARAGVLFDQSGGTLAASEASDNQYGAVIQGEPTPALEDNRLFGNALWNLWTEGSLAVPNEPIPLPGTESL